MCALDGTESLHLKFLGCVVEDGTPDPAVHGPSEIWDDAKEGLWHYCEQLGPNELQLNFGGCLFGGERIAKDGQTVSRGVVYKCFGKEADQSAGLRPVACMNFATKYDLGETFQVGQ